MSAAKLGSTVFYSLSEWDAKAINKCRNDANKHMGEHQENSNGVQIHVGNAVAEGDVFPMIITRSWTPDSANGCVFLDGNDLFWATSVTAGEGPRHFTELA